MARSRHNHFRKQNHAGKPRSHVRSRHPHRGHPTPHAPPVFVEGILQLKGAFGFVLSEDPGMGDVMVSGPSLKRAMNGDRVRTRVTSAPDMPRRSGEIVEVLTHAHSTVVGVFRRMGNLPVVAPEDEGPLVHLTNLGSHVPHIGDIVAARIESWATAQHAAKGVLTEVLGPRDASGVDLKILIAKHELPDAFPPEDVRQAEAFGAEVPESALQGRETLFHQRVFTIDGADAKDFDDAVSLEQTPDGYRLGVHIADVAQYVREGSPLDEEAYNRGTSVYLSGTVIPMLPFPLSDNLCSLRPGVVRLTLSCVMDISREGEIGEARIFESAIRSARRFTYDEVEEILQGRSIPQNVTPEIAADVREMGALARRLRKQRFARGSLDFDFPEPEVVLGLDGRPLDIRRRERLESHRLIEDFMLAANEAVARRMKHHPFLYRIHETPDPAKLEKLAKTLDLLGLSILPASGRAPRQINPSHPSALQQVIRASDGTPGQGMVHMLVLRSLKQAVYSPANKGHFGLASSCYTHFTSPIRRYPDLIVHRIVKEGLRSQNRDGYWKGRLPEIARHASVRERAAVDAEREYHDVQKVRLMESRLGESFSGVISGVTPFGLFVQLNEFFVEGLVHVSRLGSDFFIFDETRMTLRGRRSGRVFSIGQKVRVQLAGANIVKRQLDFELLSVDSQAAPARPAVGRQRSRDAHRGRQRRRR